MSKQFDPSYYFMNGAKYAWELARQNPDILGAEFLVAIGSVCVAGQIEMLEGGESDEHDEREGESP